MEIRNISPEQIEQAMAAATKKYGGNLYLKSGSVKVTLPKSEQWTETHTYTAQAQWRVFYRYEHFEYADEEETEIVGTGAYTEWEDWGYEPYVRPPYGEQWSANAYDWEEKKLVEAKVAKLRGEGDRPNEIGFGQFWQYEARYVPEHEKSYSIEHKSEYVHSSAVPLNQKGTRYRVWIGVKSSRRPGARVSQERYGGWGYNPKPRRIGSACWHAHRDFFKEIFKINPDAEIHTALAKYKGIEDFEDKFPATAYGGGMAGPAMVQGIGDACNCDEGEWLEYATEGLTEEQYELRESIWAEYPDYCHIKKPKRERALLSSRERENNGEEE